MSQSFQLLKVTLKKTLNFSYVFCVFFLLLNMFLAIISDTYSEVKADLSVSEKRYPVSEHIQSMKTSLLKKMDCYQGDRIVLN